MRCCVQNCTNDDLKKTNKSNGITFHKLPKDPVHYSSWLRVLTTAGCRLSKGLVVCSDHFLPEDFDCSRPNQRRVKAGAVPTLMASANQAELKVCRVCLALDVKMYDMEDFKLSEMFQNVTGISACDKKSVLHRVCWECTARLTAAAAFREKALLSNALLEDLVNITHNDIALLKQNHNSLKSPLIVQNVFTLSDIECEDVVAVLENKEIEISLSDDTDIIETKSKLRIIEEEKEIEFEAYEPLIDMPVKTEVECDPIADTSIHFKGRKTATLEDGAQDKKGTTEEKKNNEEIVSVDTKMTNVPMINDAESIVLVDDKKKKIKPIIIFNTQTIPKDVSVNKSKRKMSSYVGAENIVSEDTKITSVPIINDAESIVLVDDKKKKKKRNIIFNKQTKPKDVSVNQSKRKMSSKVGAENKSGRLNDKMKEKIIALKKNGYSFRAIVRETGVSMSTIDRWWTRYRKNGNTYSESTTAEAEDSDTLHGYCDNPPEPGKEMGACSEVVRQRLHEAGFEHILMKKPERYGKTEQITTSEHKALHDDLKERIIALKQEGMTNSRIAYLLNTSRITVRKWWTRWCNEGHMQNAKHTGRKRKTTPEEDQLLIDRVTQEQTVHTPSLAMELGISPECVRRRLAEAGFKHKERKAYVPLKAGRSHKVDEEIKQRIISMKLNGVSVTDIANQFRVPRTTIYQWWQRWCKDNNMKITGDNTTSTTTEQYKSLAEYSNVENSLQTPTIISSQMTLWQKLPDVESKP